MYVNHTNEKSAIKVAVRIRPPNKKESKSNNILTVDGDKIFIREPNTHTKRNFTYDYIYNQDASQEDLYNDIGKQVITNAFRGYNSCVFAYGMTGTGKSWTMMGGKSNDSGLIPRICQSLFNLQATHGGDTTQQNRNITYKMEVSYMEIYSEKVKDLMNPSIDEKHSLNVRQHPELGPYVDGLTQMLVEDYNSVKRVITKGNKERHIASTAMNDRSSRSHAILTIYFTQIVEEPDLPKPREIVSKINLVDLAGSERVESSGVTGINFKEAININKSLSTLGQVISKLAVQCNSNMGKTPPTKYRGRKKKPAPVHIPFRDSTLTWILKESLGGNSKTYMIATLSPSGDCYHETLSTLRYASNAKKIVNRVKINEDPNDKIIRILRNEIDALKTQLKVKKSSGIQSLEISQIQSDLEQRESLIREREKSWTDKLKESREMNRRIQTQMKEQLKKTEEAHAAELQKMRDERKQLLDEVDKMRNDVSNESPKSKKRSFVDTAVRLQEHYEKRINMICDKYANRDNENRLSEIKKEYDKLKTEYELMQDDKANLLREHTDLRIANAKLQAEKEKMELAHQHADAEAKKSSDVLSALKLSLTKLTDKNKALEQQLVSISQDNDKLKKEKHQNKNTIDQLSQEKNKLRNVLTNAQNSAKAINTKWITERQRRIKHAQQTQARINMLESRIRSNITSTILNDEKKRYEQLQTECSELQQQINTNRETLTKLEAYLGDLNSSIDKQKDCLKTLVVDQEKLTRLRAEYETLHSHIKKLTENLEIHTAQALVALENPDKNTLMQVRNTFAKLLNQARSSSAGSYTGTE